MSTAEKPKSGLVLPGGTIGMLGSGQLGRMTTIAAKYMGYRVHVFSPDKDSPAGQVADVEIQGDYADTGALEAFAKQVDVVTLEFENLPVAALETAGRHALVHPGIATLSKTQNRSLEKNFLKQQAIPTCQFQIVRSLQDLKLAQGLLPGILKTTTDGYDGKGQIVIRDPAEIESAWQSIQTSEAILESFVEFDFEFSVVAARNSAGQFAAYPAITNEHKNQILDVSYSPSNLDAGLNDKAIEITRDIMEALDTIGVLCVEFFCCGDKILVNEIAPRPHNSGHLTIEGHVTSQFEQQVRAVCGLPLGATCQKQPVAMANLLGQHLNDGQPHWDRALSMPGVKVHLYGKAKAVADRKMGHLVALAETNAQTRADALTARELIAAGESADAGDRAVRRNVSTIVKQLFL